MIATTATASAVAAIFAAMLALGCGLVGATSLGVWLGYAAAGLALLAIVCTLDDTGHTIEQISRKGE
jgi:hypothetical protein